MIGSGVGLVWYVALKWLEKRKSRWAKVLAQLLNFKVPGAVVMGVAFWCVAFPAIAFLIRRDLLNEGFAWKSKTGLIILFSAMMLTGVAGTLLARALSILLARSRFLVPAIIGFVVAILAGLTVVLSPLPDKLIAHAPQQPAAQAAGPTSNVLFIVIDTLRADRLSVYGYKAQTHPALEAFAQDAVVFEQAFTNSSWTRPSFATLLTGRLPNSHQVMQKTDLLPDEIQTLAESFAEAKSETWGLVTNFNVAPHYNFQQGFDEYAFLQPRFVLSADDASSKLLYFQFIRRILEKRNAARGATNEGAQYRDAKKVNSEILSWLDSRKDKQKSFFAFVGYMDPHDPYYTHPYNGQAYARAAHQHPDLDEAQTLSELYDGEIVFWDQQFANLITELKKRKLYDDLTIVITADHGEEFGDHGGFWHGTTLYDEQIRVPLLLKLPKSHLGGTRRQRWVESIDIMPTLLRLQNIPIPDHVQGGDLFTGKDRTYATEDHEGNQLEAIREYRDDGDWKLITANENNPRGLEQEELYKVDEDINERENRINDETRTAALKVILEQTKRTAEKGAAQKTEKDLSDEEVKKLCGIGYMSRETCCERGFETYCD